MEFYSTQQTANLFSLSRETIRRWAKEFTEYLSDTASAGGGRTRKFSEDDLNVFALVANLKDTGETFDSIHASLKNGQRGEIPENAKELAGISHQKKYGTLMRQVDNLTQQVRNMELAVASKDGELITIKRELQEAKNVIAQLNREIGALESKG
jgi:DNA-binding transcriptional MerR regulator